MDYLIEPINDLQLTINYIILLSIYNSKQQGSGDIIYKLELFIWKEELDRRQDSNLRATIHKAG